MRPVQGSRPRRLGVVRTVLPANDVPGDNVSSLTSIMSVFPGANGGGISYVGHQVLHQRGDLLPLYHGIPEVEQHLHLAQVQQLLSLKRWPEAEDGSGQGHQKKVHRSSCWMKQSDRN